MHWFKLNFTDLVNKRLVVDTFRQYMAVGMCIWTNHQTLYIVHHCYKDSDCIYLLFHISIQKTLVGIDMLRLLLFHSRSNPVLNKFLHFGMDLESNHLL